MSTGACVVSLILLLTSTTISHWSSTFTYITTGVMQHIAQVHLQQLKLVFFFVLHPATQRFNLWWLVKQDFYYTRCWFCFLTSCWPKTLKHRKITFCSLCAFCQICWIILCCCLLLQAKDRGQRVSIVIVSEGAIDHSGQPITANQVKEVLYYNQVFVHP